MAEVYLAVPKDYSGPNQKRKLSEIDSIINSISPPNIKYHKSKIVNYDHTGFIYSFYNDKDINFLFEPQNTDKLAENHLYVDLAMNTQSHRVLIIVDVSKETFENDIKSTKENIESQNNINILKISTFSAKSGKRLFLKIIVDSKETYEDILTSGKLKVLNENLNVEAQHNKARKTVPTGNPDIRAPPMIPPRAPPLNRPYSVVAGGRDPCAGAPAAGHKATPHAFNPNHNNAPINHSDKVISFYAEATTHICAELSKGMEDPYYFVSCVNDTYMSLGLPIIPIPHHFISTQQEFKLGNQISFSPFPLHHSLDLFRTIKRYL